MEDHQASRPQMLGKLFEHRRRILLEYQDIAADDGVERLVEYHLDGIALAKEHIAAPTRKCSCPRDRYSSRRLVNPDDRTAVTNQVSRQERHVSGAAPDIKHAHARDESSLAEEPSRDRIDNACLLIQASEFLIGMAKKIRGHLEQ